MSKVFCPNTPHMLYFWKGLVLTNTTHQNSQWIEFFLKMILRKHWIHCIATQSARSRNITLICRNFGGIMIMLLFTEFQVTLQWTQFFLKIILRKNWIHCNVTWSARNRKIIGIHHSIYQPEFKRCIMWSNIHLIS